jgi:hypothetical protein
MSDDAQRRADSGSARNANRRLGLILASVAAAFAIGFIAKIALFGAP